MAFYLLSQAWANEQIEKSTGTAPRISFNLMSQSPLDRGVNEARLVILTYRLLRFSCAHRQSRPPILGDCDQTVAVASKPT
jgi:hypothetical protein